MADKQVRVLFHGNGCLLGSRHLSVQSELITSLIELKCTQTTTIITWQPQTGNWKFWSYRLLVDLKGNSFLTLLATTSLTEGWVPLVSKGFHFGQPLPITNYTYMAGITAQPINEPCYKAKTCTCHKWKRKEEGEWDNWLKITSHAAPRERCSKLLSMRIQIDHWPEALVALFVVNFFNPFVPTPSVRNRVPCIACDVIGLRGKHLTRARGREAREQVNFKIDENLLALPTRTSFHLIPRS